MEFPLIISLASGIIGISLLITSSIFLDNWINWSESTCPIRYKLNPEICSSPYTTYYMVAGSFGIIASIVQISTFVLVWYKKWKIWSGVHVFVFIFSVAAFAICIDEHGDDWALIDSERGTKAKSFLAFSAIDFIFSFFAPWIMHHITKDEYY